VDVVPELFYVATWFFHVDFLPLIPPARGSSSATAGINITS